MRPTYALSPVICLLDAAPRRTEPWEVVVELDARTGRLPSGPFSLLAPKKHLLVRNQRSPGGAQAQGRLELQLDPLVHKAGSGLSIDYRASCPEGNEQQLTLALAHGTSPQETFDSLLLQWSRQHLLARAETLTRQFPVAMADLARHLRDRAATVLGLDLTAEIRLSAPPPSEPLVVGPAHFEVRARDWDPKVDLTVEAEAELLPGAEILAQSALGVALDYLPLLRRELTAFFSTEVGLHELACELADQVRPRAERHLQAAMARHGLTLRRLVLASTRPVSTAPRNLAVSHRFLARLAEYPKPVEVKTEMILELADVRPLLAAGEPDLEAWAQEQAEEVTRDCLFGVKFLELCKTYEERKLRIEQSMKERAAEIGYRIRQIFTITDLPIDTLARPSALDLDDEELSLYWEQVKARLAVHAIVRIPDVERIAELLNHDRDVPQAMAAAVRQEVAAYLHQVHPDQFFLRFDSPAEADANRSVREELEERIRRVLAEGFGAEVSALTCKPLPTELTHCLDQLGSRAIEIPLVFDRFGGQSPVPVHAALEIVGVGDSREDWLAFHNKHPTPEDLAQRAKQHLLQFLADFAQKQPPSESSEAGKKEAGQHLEQELRMEFGLTARLINWRRDLLPEEIKLREHNQETLGILLDRRREQLLGDPTLRTEILKGERQRAQDIFDQLRGLRARVHQLILEGGAQHEIDRAEQQIERLEKERELMHGHALAPAKDIAALDRFSKQLTGASSPGPSLQLGEGSASATGEDTAAPAEERP